MNNYPEVGSEDWASPLKGYIDGSVSDSEQTEDQRGAARFENPESLSARALAVSIADEVETNIETPTGTRFSLVEVISGIVRRSVETALSAKGAHANLSHLIYDPAAADLVVSKCAITADLVNFKVDGKGVKATTTGAQTSALVRRNPVGGELLHGHASAVGLGLFIEDVTKLTSSVQVSLNNGDGSTWVRTIPVADLQTGHNQIRWVSSQGARGAWLKFTLMQVLFSTTDSTSITIKSLWLEEPARDKATLVFINDGNRRNFEDYLGSKLRARGFPVQWAISCIATQNATTSSDRLTVGELLELQARGDSVSFHNYDGLNQIMSTATAPEVVLWTTQAQDWLKAHGFRGWPFRSAWLQNTAPNASAAWPQLAAAPSNIGASSYNSWPLSPRLQYPRITLHQRPAAAVDADFEVLKSTRGLYVVYTHDVNPAGGRDLTPTEADYFLAKVDQAVEEGWLEGATMETLFARDGAVYLDGGERFQFTDTEGVTRIV